MKNNKTVKCPQCNSEDLSHTSEPSYICNNCGYPNKIKYEYGGEDK